MFRENTINSLSITNVCNESWIMSHIIQIFHFPKFFFRNFQNDFPALFAQQHGAIHISIDSSGPPLVTSEVKSLKSTQKKLVFESEHSSFEFSNSSAQAVTHQLYKIKTSKTTLKTTTEKIIDTQNSKINFKQMTGSIQLPEVEGNLSSICGNAN